MGHFKELHIKELNRDKDAENKTSALEATIKMIGLTKDLYHTGTIKDRDERHNTRIDLRKEIYACIEALTKED